MTFNNAANPVKLPRQMLNKKFLTKVLLRIWQNDLRFIIHAKSAIGTSMIRIWAIAFVLLAIFLTSASHAENERDCQMRQARACYAIEKDKDNSTRYGLSASEACAANAIIECHKSEY